MARLLGRLGLAMAAALFALFFLTVALIFLHIGFYMFLAGVLTSKAAAALLVGVSGLIVTALLGLSARWALQSAFSRPKPKRVAGAAPPPAGSRSPLADLADQLGYAGAGPLMAQATAHPYHAVVASLLAGLAVGVSPKLRGTLREVLRP